MEQCAPAMITIATTGMNKIEMCPLLPPHKKAVEAWEQNQIQGSALAQVMRIAHPSKLIFHSPC